MKIYILVKILILLMFTLTSIILFENTLQNLLKVMYQKMKFFLLLKTKHYVVMDSLLSFSSSSGMTLRVTWYQQFNVFFSTRSSQFHKDFLLFLVCPGETNQDSFLKIGDHLLPF